MNDETSREPFDYTAAVVAMLTLRINTPTGDWLADEDHDRFWQFVGEAEAAEGVESANEYLLLEMMNMAWEALTRLAAATGEREATWLQRIAAERQAWGQAGE